MIRKALLIIYRVKQIHYFRHKYSDSLSRTTLREKKIEREPQQQQRHNSRPEVKWEKETESVRPAL